LKGRGYYTGLVGKWGLGELGTPGEPNRQGFDEYFGYVNQGHAHNYFTTHLWRNGTKVPLRNIVPNENPFGMGVATTRVDYTHDLFAKEALAFVDRNYDHPFFLYLALTIPHANGESKTHGQEVPGYGNYGGKPWPENEMGFAAMISRMDKDIGELFTRLKSLNLDESTIVIFTSDNGPHREGGHDSEFFDSNGALRGIKRDLYEGGIRVPALVRWPGKVPAGVVNDSVWSFSDVLPTLASIAGAKAPSHLDGIDLLPLLLGQKTQLADRFLYWEFHEKGFQQAARFGKWKAVRKGIGQPLEIFDLSTDVGETADVASKHPDVVARFEKYLKTARTESKDWPLSAGTPRN
jgi:arylsulfatase A-like enzyme